ncbi:MAG: H+transporting two-sector ATPase C subunit [Candidatus Hydrogenedentes bacterium]|nr:H+transporting two-sector ATPase C subunit [Candidatus Hydrogenedentota bacterium]
MSYRSSRTTKVIAFAVSLAAVTLPVLVTSIAWAQAEEGPTQAADPEALKWGLIAAAVSVSFGCLGAAAAVAYVGAAAVAAVAEKPQLAGRTLIFVGLAEGIAIYGLIIAIMILGKV